MSVSIVIPSFERPELLDRLLKSIEHQTYKKFEVHVVDDYSKNTEEIERVVNKYKTLMNIKFTKNASRMGAPYSRNQGIRSATYDLIALVDDDDEWRESKLEKQVKAFEESSERVGIVYTWTEVVNTNREVIRVMTPEIEGDARSEILTECFIPSPSVMVKKSAIVEAGLFDESFPSCQDWDTWTRIIFKGYEVKVCKEILTYYLKHDGPTIGTSPRAKQGFILYYKKHFFKLLYYGKIRHIVRLFRLMVGI